MDDPNLKLALVVGYAVLMGLSVLRTARRDGRRKAATHGLAAVLFAAGPSNAVFGWSRSQELGPALNVVVGFGVVAGALYVIREAISDKGTA